MVATLETGENGLKMPAYRSGRRTGTRREAPRSLQAGLDVNSLRPQASEFPKLTGVYERMMAKPLSSEQLPLKPPSATS